MNVSDDLKQISVQIEPMVVSDLAQVMEIDQAAFPSPWSTRAYEYELRYNEMAHYFVARLDPDTLERAARGSWRQRLQHLWTRQRPAPVSLLVGYVGYWLMAGEAHISTIAVRENYRGRSLGELLLAFALQDAARRSAHVATLEVRVSNLRAQQLYVKYDFEKVGMRKAYYSDNNEDAFIMTTPPLHSAAYQEKQRRLRTALIMRFQERADKTASAAQPHWQTH
ncbi:ribosomal-protein-alanine N-acetyltransferase [Anaerolineae bacterium CFX7]|nr:ribosomal-protein-alanine N-acetyltransferase [Anaerolineae bacterium CFX7]